MDSAEIAYTVVLAVSAFWFLLFAVSFTREQRRLRNGVYLFFALLFLGLGLVLVLASISGPAAGVVVLLAVLSIPVVILALAVFLIANGVTMMHRESKRLGNLLSLLLGVGIIALLVLRAAFANIPWVPGQIALYVVTAIVIYFAFLFLCFLLYSIFYGRIPHRRDIDFVVVLGSGLRGSKVPPLLAGRLTRARVAFQKEIARGRHAMIITSGGQGPDESVPEAHAMAEFLERAGVPADRILREDRSTTTTENLLFSHKIMQARRPGYRCLVVTNNYHVLRAAMTARRAKVNGQVIGSPTALYFLPSAMIREFVALLLEHRVANLVVCGLITLAYTLPELVF